MGAGVMRAQGPGVMSCPCPLCVQMRGRPLWRAPHGPRPLRRSRLAAPTCTPAPRRPSSSGRRCWRCPLMWRSWPGSGGSSRWDAAGSADAAARDVPSSWGRPQAEDAIAPTAQQCSALMMHVTRSRKCASCLVCMCDVLRTLPAVLCWRLVSEHTDESGCQTRPSTARCLRHASAHAGVVACRSAPTTAAGARCRRRTSCWRPIRLCCTPRRAPRWALSCRAMWWVGTGCLVVPALELACRRLPAGACSAAHRLWPGWPGWPTWPSPACSWSLMRPTTSWTP